MTEFFKELVSQLSAVWQKLTVSQKIITTSLVGFTFLALISLIIWSDKPQGESGFRKLYSSIDQDEMTRITELLNNSGYEYRIGGGGNSISVKKDKIYKVRMLLAGEGLPSSNIKGYELFDDNNIGVTDYVQKLNARRALEGELQRTIEGLEEIKSARIHIVIPKPTIFLKKQKDAKASVTLKQIPGRKLKEDGVRAISHLVSASVEGLNPQNVSIVDYSGKLLSNPYSDDQTAFASSRNVELQRKVELSMEKKVRKILNDVLGPGNATVQISADLNFNEVEKTLEQYDPEGQVVRSEERSSEDVTNAPDGDRENENSITNYEIDKTVEHIVEEVGSVDRISVAVAVDGSYEENEGEAREYVARSEEEITKIENMVKNAVGYDLARGDQVQVTNMQFDKDYLHRQREDMEEQEKIEFWMNMAKYGIIVLIIIAGLILLRYIASTIAEAMNPPVPEVSIRDVEADIPAEVPEEVRESNELLEKVEMITQEQPVNVSTIIRDWLSEKDPNP